MKDAPPIVDTIIKHHQNHAVYCMEVCPLILTRKEMWELKVFVEKFYSPILPRRDGNPDIEAFHGVKLVVIDKESE
jgi:hypothetical protein